MKTLSVFSEYCFKFCKYFLIGTIALIPVIVFLQVIMRYVFGNALFWVEELARYAMVWGTCLGACLAIKTDEHIRLVFLLSKFKHKSNKIITLIVDLVTTIFFVLLGIYSYTLAIGEWGQVSAAMEIPMSFVHISMFVMSVFSLVFLIEKIAINLLYEIKKPSHPGI